VALLALACATVGIVTYVALHSALLSQLDSQLTVASRRYLNCLHPPPAPGGDGHRGGNGHASGGQPINCAHAPGTADHTLSAAISDGVLLDAATPAGRCTLSATETASLIALPRSGQPYTRTLPTLGTYRLMAVVGQGGTVYVSGLPLNSVDAAMRHVELTEMAVFSAALLLAGMIGTGWVRLSLRPLRRVTITAAEVASLPLGSGEVDLPHRVPDADVRTEVGQLGAAFNQMLGHVESSLARRHASEDRLRTFAADASHELRTPLAAIRGYAELARRHPGALPDEVAHALSRVESESARMSTLVDDLLLLARLDAGRPLEQGTVDLTRLAIDAASDARVAGPEHRWRLELPDDPVLVTGDENRLRQVLANLLSNARVHTRAGTTVTVALRSTAGSPGGIELSVTDDGPGIAAELLPGIFERFARGDTSRSRGSGSTGLGLAIVAAVIAAHHGTVSVTSRPGRTGFVVTLPVRPASEAGPG